MRVRKQYGVCTLVGAIALYCVVGFLKDQTYWRSLSDRCGNGERVQGVMYLSNPSLPLQQGDLCFLGEATDEGVRVATFRLSGREWTLDKVSE